MVQANQAGETGMRAFIEATWILVGFWIVLPWVLLTVTGVFL